MSTPQLDWSVALEAHESTTNVECPDSVPFDMAERMVGLRLNSITGPPSFSCSLFRHSSAIMFASRAHNSWDIADNTDFLLNVDGPEPRSYTGVELHADLVSRYPSYCGSDTRHSHCISSFVLVCASYSEPVEHDSCPGDCFCC